jgi:hypothetical protein
VHARSLAQSALAGKSLRRGHCYIEPALRLSVHFKQDDLAFVLPL